MYSRVCFCCCRCLSFFLVVEKYDAGKFQSGHSYLSNMNPLRHLLVLLYVSQITIYYVLTFFSF